MPTTITPKEFRQRLAGLADPAAGEDVDREDYGPFAAEFVLMLAIAFNRRTLDATTLWTRIGSAIERGLAACDGDDLDRLVSVALEHVQANINVVACEDHCVSYQSRLRRLPKEARVYFCRYLADHRYPVIVMGRDLWEQRKELIKTKIAQLDITEETEATE
jgi:hypothetical protein